MENTYNKIVKNNKLIDFGARHIASAKTITVYVAPADGQEGFEYLELEYAPAQYHKAYANAQKTDFATSNHMARVVSNAAKNPDLFETYVSSKSEWSLNFLTTYRKIEEVIVEFNDGTSEGLRRDELSI